MSQNICNICFWNKLQERKGIKLMTQTAYSPDLTSLDYYLFQSMAHFLHPQSFNKEVEASAREFFTSKDKNFYLHRIKELTERQLQTVQHKGFYLEWLAVFVLT